MSFSNLISYLWLHLIQMLLSSPINTCDVPQMQHQCCNGQHSQPHSRLPLPIPPVDTQSRSPKPLPNVLHVPPLTGHVDFGTWNDSVRTLILHMGLLRHIANPPPIGYAPLPDRIPSYMPTLSLVPSTMELMTYRNWWEDDNIVTHILIS